MLNLLFLSFFFLLVSVFFFLLFLIYIIFLLGRRKSRKMIFCDFFFRAHYGRQFFFQVNVWRENGGRVKNSVT